MKIWPLPTANDETPIVVRKSFGQMIYNPEQENVFGFAALLILDFGLRFSILELDGISKRSPLSTNSN
ncbi:MAG: hypothetical protein AAGD25_25920 [Cyanobacteria bacterium P01_F01_bin.150]